MIKVSDYIAKRLKEVYFVNHFFMISGGGAMHLNDSLGCSIEYTANHHEQACAIAAEGFARLNQDLAVVNVTTGPGGLNCLNGVFGQWTDSAPVLYISGQVKSTTTISSCPELSLRQLGDQEVDIVSVVRPLTKYAKMVAEPNDIKYHLDKAIYEAMSDRKGPVWLDIPMDVQSSMVDEPQLKDFFVPKTVVSDLKIDEVVMKIKSAKRPLIIAGHGIRLSKTEDIFYDLLENTDVPVVTTLNGFDLIEDSHKNYVGRIGTIGQRSGNFALQNADLVICLGTRNNIRQASYNYENFAKNAFKIVVDIDCAELEKPTVVADLKVNADLKDFLPEFVKHMPEIDCSKWLQFSRDIKDKYCFDNCSIYDESCTEINPYKFTNMLTSLLKTDDVVTMANGSATVCTFQTGVVKRGQRFILNSGDASMGYGLPAAIGACLANGRKPVICLEGDGSVMMNIQEFQTIKHNNLPIKVFVINNNGYISIRQTQNNFFGGRMTGSCEKSGVSIPDFLAVAKAFGLDAIRIDDKSKVESQIKEVLDFDGPVVCEVVVKSDYIFTPKLSSRKLEDGTMVSASLEDLYPFLDRSEFEKNLL